MNDMSHASSLAPDLSHAEIRSILFGVMLAMFLAALDQTIVATALPTIGRELGDLEHLPWVVTAYLLSATAIAPLYGKVADIVGRRVTLLVAITVFVAGSVACAIAPTLLTLILARALQGLGGGGLMSLSQTIIGDIVSPKERPRYQGYIAGVYALSSISGPVLGGFISQHLHWSFIFWINVPLGFAALAMTNAILKKLPRHERPHRLDVLGAALMACATVTLMLALNWGGVRLPWTSPEILGLAGASLALWVLFVIRLRTAPEPLIPADVLANPVVARGVIAACFGMGVFIGLTIYTPIYLEAVHGLSASATGLALIPLMAGTVTGATISGRVMARVTHYKRLPLCGLVMAMAALLALAAKPRDLPLAALEVLLALTSLGLGALLPITTVSIQNAVMPHQLGTATGSMNFFRQLGGALIVAGFGAIVLGGLPPGAAAGASVENLSAAFARSGLDMAATFRWVFVAAACGLAAAFVSLSLMEERPLRSRASSASAPAPEIAGE
ncbi:MDR family MFS transporter [Terrarubrum flagellatum]|uniref:MDR family MFS transporter n=1 Tax=Terrirubrum flagellatum TaxID=2895980 RepID=UPI003144D381